MKFRWSEWLTAAALVLAFSAIPFKVSPQSR